MTLLTVLEYPDKRLRQKALPVAEVTAEVQRIVDDMFETLYAEEAAGLASVQVNIPLRIIVMDVSENYKSPICAINPEIISAEGVQFEYEGCISFPTVYDRVERAARVKMRALDRDGKPYEIEAEGLLAKCIQHEIDHLNGILYIDYLSRLKQDRLVRKMEKARVRAE